MQKITFTTEDGEGEATKEAQDKPWEVSMPNGDFRWHGDLALIKREIRRRNNDKEVQFNPQ